MLRKQLVYNGGNLCGGIDIYIIQPSSAKFNTIYEMENISTDLIKYPFQRWEQLWTLCDGWVDSKLLSTYKGKIHSGVFFAKTGNGIKAIVRDQFGRLLYICGIWG